MANKYHADLTGADLHIPKEHDNTYHSTNYAASGANSDITALTGLTGDVYNNAWADYSATSTVVGWTSFTTKAIYTKKIGKTVFVMFHIDGTSNSTAVTFTLPYTNNANAIATGSSGYCVDNGSALTTASRADIGLSENFVAVFKDMATGVWTNSGTKRVTGSIFYESA